MEIPESFPPSYIYIIVAYAIIAHLFVFFRIIVFNFALKKIKRPLSIACDISLFVATTIYLFYLYLQDMIYYGYDSPTLLFAGSVYLFLIFDFIYNYILYKKIKVSNESEQN